MIPYKQVKTQNFKSILSLARVMAVGFVSLLMVIVAIIIQTYKSGMATELNIISFTVTPLFVIATSGILAILISMEENARITTKSSFGD